MINIVQKEDPVLRNIAKPVPVSDITSAMIKGVIKDMKEAMLSQKDGLCDLYFVENSKIKENNTLQINVGI